MKKTFYVLGALIVVAVAVLLLTTIDTSMENSVKVSGTVKSISEAGVKDMVFELENHEITYYINRGFENGFNLAKAKKDFEGKNIKLFYAKSWTPLAPFGTKCKHVTHAVVNDSVIFSEW
ncbi:hypothetical protein [Flavobacterium sp.]